LESLHHNDGGTFFLSKTFIKARLLRGQFPWHFVRHFVYTQGRSLDARRWRDQFLQPFPQRSACGIGQSLIGRRLFLESLHHNDGGTFF
jgi:hypothetical protein